MCYVNDGRNAGCVIEPMLSGRFPILPVRLCWVLLVTHNDYLGNQAEPSPPGTAVDLGLTHVNVVQACSPCHRCSHSAICPECHVAGLIVLRAHIRFVKCMSRLTSVRPVVAASIKRTGVRNWR